MIRFHLCPYGYKCAFVLRSDIVSSSKWQNTSPDLGEITCASQTNPLKACVKILIIPHIPYASFYNNIVTLVTVKSLENINSRIRNILMIEECKNCLLVNSTILGGRGVIS